jgi:hypothetical protein
MAAEVDPPERQAEDALRAAVRAIDAERDAGYPQCNGGPDCQCPFHWGARLPIEEAALRAHRRKIADAMNTPGECTACGMDDRPVKGPAGAELCEYCDQLRILPPPPGPPKWASGKPVIRRRPVLSTRDQTLAISTLLVISGVLIIMMYGHQWPIGVALWLFGFGYGLRK